MCINKRITTVSKGKIKNVLKNIDTFCFKNINVELQRLHAKYYFHITFIFKCQVSEQFGNVKFELKLKKYFYLSLYTQDY